ncbi:hypothetical protein RND71_008181 [Anisodus tanguticus]|uniref:Uncharacterized protein n=1 Tax=Anisodus tanguticus TaxID=243964 RepID=A0AAE1SP44_9SOLA|nr:hypothetical protein RND71_008181 [Anisodus tanguticus]
MIERVLANQERTDKSMKGLTEVVDSHTASIQKLESQMRDFSREQYLKQRGTLPSHTIQNPKNNVGDVVNCNTITTGSGKLLQSEAEKVVDLEPADDEIPILDPSIVEVDDVVVEKPKAPEVIT